MRLKPVLMNSRGSMYSNASRTHQRKAAGEQLVPDAEVSKSRLSMATASPSKVDLGDSNKDLPVQEKSSSSAHPIPSRESSSNAQNSKGITSASPRLTSHIEERPEDIMAQEGSFRPKAITQVLSSIKLEDRKTESPDSKIEYKSHDAYDARDSDKTNSLGALMRVGGSTVWNPDGPSGVHFVPTRDFLGSQVSQSIPPDSRDNTLHPKPGHPPSSGSYAALVAGSPFTAIKPTSLSAAITAAGNSFSKSQHHSRRSSIAIARASMRIAHFSTSTLHDLTGKTGSLIYMAPEVMMGMPYNQQADVFSFAITCYEIIHRRLIVHMILEAHFRSSHQQKEIAVVEYASAVAAGYRPPLSPTLPPSLNELFVQCWAANPLHRPDMKIIVEKLDRILKTEDLAPLGLPPGNDRGCGCIIS
jgi:hypothetical protein